VTASRIASRYAEALLGLAQARDATDDVRGELRSLVDLIGNTPQLGRLLERPDLPPQAKLDAIQQAIGDTFSETIVALLATLVRHQRGDIVAQVAEAFEELDDAARGVVRAEAHTVVPLSENQQARLVAALERRTGRKVKLLERVDPTVLAGLRLQVGDKLIDGSAAGRLTRMREQLVNERGQKQ